MTVAGALNPIGREEAQRRAAEELAGSGYVHESVLDRIYRAVRQIMDEIFAFEGSGSDAVDTLVGVLVVVLLLAGLTALVLWQLRRTSRSAAAPGGLLFGERSMSAAEHRQAAETAAGAGRWGEAIRERLRAIARDLEERALVEAMPGRTADELAVEAGRVLPGFAAELADAARRFDEVSYGELPGTPEAYATLRDLDERLRVARPVLA